MILLTYEDMEHVAIKSLLSLDSFRIYNRTTVLMDGKGADLDGVPGLIGLVGGSRERFIEPSR